MRVRMMLLLGASALVIDVRTGGAQTATKPPLQSVFVSLGPTSSTGGELYERSASALSVAAERTIKRFGSLEALGGIGVLYQHRAGSDLTCKVRANGAPGCAPLEPNLRAWSPLVGIRYRSTHGELALKGGPDVYHTTNSPGDPNKPQQSGVGVLLGAKLAAMVTRHAGLAIAYDRHRVRYYDQTVHVSATTLGLQVAW